MLYSPVCICSTIMWHHLPSCPLWHHNGISLEQTTRYFFSPNMSRAPPWCLKVYCYPPKYSWYTLEPLNYVTIRCNALITAYIWLPDTYLYSDCARKTKEEKLSGFRHWNYFAMSFQFLCFNALLCTCTLISSCLHNLKVQVDVWIHLIALASYRYK